MNNTHLLPKAGQNTPHTQSPGNPGTAVQQANEAIQPATGAAQQIAAELSNSIPGHVFLSACSLLAQNYLPQPSFMRLLRETLPAQHNPFASLENSGSIDDLPNCHARLERMFGINQSSKSDLFGTDQLEQTSVAAHLIKNLARIVLANQDLSAQLNSEQHRGIAAFANYLAEFTQSDPRPQQIIEQLTPNEALAFLKCLSGPHAIQPFARSTSDIRQKLALHFIDEAFDDIELLPRDFCNDKHFIEQAILIHPDRALAFASEALQNDPDIEKLVAYRQGDKTLDTPTDPEDINNPLMVIAAACNDEAELHFMSEELKTDREFILATVAHEPFVLSLVNMDLYDDPEFMLAAVGRHGWALEYASERVANNHDIVMTAIKKHGNALQFANDSFTNNLEIVLAAVSQEGTMLRFVSDALKDNKEVVLAALTENPLALAYASNTLKNDFQTVRTAVEQDGSALQFASFRLSNNYNIVSTAINNDPLALDYASYRMKNNYDLVLAAVSRNGLALEFATPRLRHNQELFRIASTNVRHEMQHEVVSNQEN